jgi:hypothetical protein
MEILTPTHSDQVPSALNNPAANLLRPAQMVEHYNDLKVAESDLENPKVQDKGAVRQRVGNLKRQYESQAPRPITNGQVKDALAKEASDLLDKILPGMLSQEEMRKNPAGSVDKHLRWERANKARIVRWKKIQCVLNADGSDPHTWDRDAANLERFRPQGPQDKFRTDAQITGQMTYRDISDEKWEQTFGTTHPENSALNQAKRASADPLREILKEAQTPIDSGIDLDTPLSPLPISTMPIETRGRKPMSAERRRIVAANLARGREAKKQRLSSQIKE